MSFSLESERLLIRNLRDSDLDDFFLYRSNPQITKFQGFDTYTNKEQAMNFISSMKDKKFGLEGEWLQLGIILKSQIESDNKLIGDCAVNISDNTAQIGCTISNLHQKKGYAKEVLHMLMKYLFEEHNIRRIVETTDEENISAQKLLESLGFRKEGLFIENCFIKGKWCNDIQYAMLKSEWDLKNNS